jgi:hypothetical protein
MLDGLAVLEADAVHVRLLDWPTRRRHAYQRAHMRPTQPGCGPPEVGHPSAPFPFV